MSDSHTSSGGTYEMQWDCKFCGEEKLLGKTHRFCPVCGAVQDPNSRYYPSDEEKVAVEDHAYVGADRICSACNSNNSGSAEYCTECGAPLSEAARAKTLEAQSRTAEGEFASSGSRDIVKERFDSEMERVGVTKKKKTSQGINFKVLGIIGAVIAVIIAGIVALTMTKSASVFVTGHSWEREVRIEEYGPQNGSDWDDNVPGGAYSVSCSQRQRDTNRVPDGEECTTRRIDQGDGTYREEQQCRTTYREEPVYDQWCTFTIDRWEYERSATANGSSVNDTPYWPEYSLNCEGQSTFGCERMSDNNEAYYVHLRGEGDNTYECPFPQGEWANIAVESAWTVQIRVVDAGAANCDTLERSG